MRRYLNAKATRLFYLYIVVLRLLRSLTLALSTFLEEKNEILVISGYEYRETSAAKAVKPARRAETVF